jgi:hypothetical protein
MAASASCGDADMERLALEYLPLMFSRRHGDPSRPWNHFSIDIRNDDGSDKLNYQGNWRDIFQNWEALAISYPEFIESFVAKFVNASTADGYNPYRISKNGIDWEVLDAQDPWSNIGYWGDHQVAYLLKLLELSRRYHPGKIGGLLSKEIFVFADVPYRIKGYEALVSDPRDTIEYDNARAGEVAKRVARLGSDGKLLSLADGSIYRVNLLEKLLLSALSKIGNFVPDGGIWMNTQRPEWNDANNALVGYGLSMVTLCYLRRFLVLLAELLDDDAAENYPLSAEVCEFFTGIHSVMKNSQTVLGAGFNAQQRKTFMDQLGRLSEEYRKKVYVGFCGDKVTLDKSELDGFINLAVQYFDQSIAGNRREDGLYHSYNLIQFNDEANDVEQLYEMLEGQVAVLSSGYLDAKDSLTLLQNLRASKIYRSDQNSYMLYPDRKQASFLEKNVIPESYIEGNVWAEKELESDRSNYIEQDIDGKIHFKGRFRNAAELSAEMEADEAVGNEITDSICELYEEIFEHRQFTGRSGSMYKYEGLGCIYFIACRKRSDCFGISKYNR